MFYEDGGCFRLMARNDPRDIAVRRNARVDLSVQRVCDSSASRINKGACLCVAKGVW